MATSQQLSAACCLKSQAGMAAVGLWGVLQLLVLCGAAASS
jgi:hypothetical protein